MELQDVDEGKMESDAESDANEGLFIWLYRGNLIRTLSVVTFRAKSLRPAVARIYLKGDCLKLKLMQSLVLTPVENQV